MEILCSSSSTVPLVMASLYGEAKLAENDFNASTPHTYGNQFPLVQCTSFKRIEDKDNGMTAHNWNVPMLLHALKRRELVIMHIL